MTSELYTTQLQAGLGLLSETKDLLELWEPSMTATDLERIARKTGHFPNVTARRLRNIVVECFGTRYLIRDGFPAILLKLISNQIDPRSFKQTCMIYTCRANPILGDFIRNVYWPTEATAREKSMETIHARRFVEQAIHDGRTKTPWSESTIRKVSSYLTGACGDFGLLEDGAKQEREILPFRITTDTTLLLAYDLHFQGLSDQAVISSDDWALFGLSPIDAIDNLKQLMTRDHLIIQTGAGVSSISWSYKTIEEVTRAVA